MRCVAIVGLLFALATACKRSTESHAPPQASPGSASEVAKDLLAPNGLEIRTSSDSEERVRNVFPRGPATEDARKEVGVAPPPPADDPTPDPSSDWIAELALPTALAGETVRAALPPTEGKGHNHFVKGRTPAGAWLYVEDDRTKTEQLERVAIEVGFVQADEAITASELQREVAWARALAVRLGVKTPTFSMTNEQALAKAKATIDLHRRLDKIGDTSVGLVLTAPPGKKFAGRLVWDVVYSAGFRWGDGDYFHWVPSPDTDVSQGIGMGATTGTGYFFPEWVAANDGSADVDGLEMSIAVPRTWQPTKVFDVMVRAATYMARRLGGTVTEVDGRAFNAKAARERVEEIERAMTAAGIVPGAELALRVF